MYRWKHLRMKIRGRPGHIKWLLRGSDGSSGRFFVFGISLQVQGVSRWAGPVRDDQLAWDMQVHTMAYETEPDEKIQPGSDALCVCNLCHGICRVARVDKKGRYARFGMILRGMSSWTRIERKGNSLFSFWEGTYAETDSTHDTHALQFLPELFRDHILIDGI